MGTQYLTLVAVVMSGVRYCVHDINAHPTAPVQSPPQRNGQFAQPQFWPHAQEGPHLQAFGAAAHLQTGTHLHGLHLHFSVIGELHSLVCGGQEIRHGMDRHLNVTANFPQAVSASDSCPWGHRSLRAGD